MPTVTTAIVNYTQGNLRSGVLGLPIFQEGVTDLLVNQRTFDPFLEDSEFPFT